MKKFPNIDYVLNMMAKADTEIPGEQTGQWEPVKEEQDIQDIVDVEDYADCIRYAEKDRLSRCIGRCLDEPVDNWLLPDWATQNLYTIRNCRRQCYCASCNQQADCMRRANVNEGTVKIKLRGCLATFGGLLSCNNVRPIPSI